MGRSHEGFNGGDTSADVKRGLGKRVAEFLFGPSSDNSDDNRRGAARGSYIIHNDDWAYPVGGPVVTLEQFGEILDSMSDEEFRRARDDMSNPPDDPDAVQ